MKTVKLNFMPPCKETLSLVVIAIIIFGNVTMITKSLLTKDYRFGWGMFHEHVSYSLSYNWVTSEGKKIPYYPKKDLSAQALYLNEGQHIFYYGHGTLVSWIEAYTEWIYTNKNYTQASFIEANITYTQNHDYSHAKTITFPTAYSE